MSTDLREELLALAETQTFSPDPAAWDRGRRARRRSRVAAAVTVVALVVGVGGLGALAVRPDSVAPADVVPDGAIPSRIVDPGELTPETDLAVGRASVAFFSAVSGLPVVVDAEDGSYHSLDLDDAPETGIPLALSPDGRTLAWANHTRIHTLDLESGVPAYYPFTKKPVSSVTAVHWSADSAALLWNGVDRTGKDVAGVLPVGHLPEDRIEGAALRGIASPSGEIVALASRATAPAAPFLRADGGGRVVRTLARDLYPDGATVTPLGWADDSLLVAEVDAPAGSYVEGRHIVLLTSPDRPKVEWTYRIMVRDVSDVEGLSVAVDLVPDLDGTSSQQLTHDFTAPGEQPWRERAPYALGGLLVLLAGLAFIRMTRHQA